MAKKKKTTAMDTETAQQRTTDAGDNAEREGQHGERLSEQIIDNEVATDTIEGKHSVEEDDVRSAFESEDRSLDEDRDTVDR